jgi:hypothetical protein
MMGAIRFRASGRSPLAVVRHEGGFSLVFRLSRVYRIVAAGILAVDVTVAVFVFGTGELGPLDWSYDAEIVALMLVPAGQATGHPAQGVTVGLELFTEIIGFVFQLAQAVESLLAKRV